MKERSPLLLLCPFCGGAAHIDRDGGSYGYVSPSVRCGCESCDFWLPKQYCEQWTPDRGTYDITVQATERAIRAWNRRYV